MMFVSFHIDNRLMSFAWLSTNYTTWPWSRQQSQIHERCSYLDIIFRAVDERFPLLNFLRWEPELARVTLHDVHGLRQVLQIPLYRFDHIA